MKYRIREVKTSEYTVYYAEKRNLWKSFSWEYVDPWSTFSLNMEDALKEIEDHKERIRRRKNVTIIHKVDG